MKHKFTIKILLIVTTLGMLACNKSTNVKVTNNNATTRLTTDGSLVIGKNVFALMYATKTFTHLGWPQPFEFHGASVYFQTNSTINEKVKISCNDSVLQPIPMLKSFIFFGDRLFDTTAHHVSWKIEGNSQLGIPNMQYVDAEPWPTNFDYTANIATVIVDEPITISFPTLPPNYAGITLTIESGDNEKSYGLLGNSNTTFTFPIADVKAVVKNQQSLTIRVGAIHISTQVINDKEYNFIKSYNVSKSFPLL